MASSHPDSNLYPHATGAAGKMALAHQAEHHLKLYSGWFCPFVQRVLLVLLEKDIPFQYIEVNPYHKPQSLLSLNPRGLVPTLEYNNKPLYESTVICEFLEDAYPSATPRLLPEDPYERARCRIWIDYVGSRIIPAFHRFLQYQSKGADDPGLGRVRTEFLGKLQEFTDAMDPEGPYFLGKEISLVDLILAPWAVRLWVFDHFKGGLGMQAHQGRWGIWLKAIEGRDSIRDTTSEMEHYVPIYQKYADDVAQSELAKATREGKGVP